VSPPTGDVITTLLLDSRVGVVDAAYAVEHGKIKKYNVFLVLS
jgi:hypothetical protein